MGGVEISWGGHIFGGYNDNGVGKFKRAVPASFSPIFAGDYIIIIIIYKEFLKDLFASQGTT